MKIRLHSLILAVVSAFIFVGIGCAVLTKYSEHSPTISPDGKMLIYQADRDAPNNFQLYVKLRTSAGWSTAFSISNISSSAGDGAPFITYDQNYLLFSSRRRGGQGDVDIWMAKRLGSFFEAPVNFGKPINSPGYDGFASLSPDKNTLYFVRQCPEKKLCRDGGFGIFWAQYQKGVWGVPRKMPAPINSNYCEFGPVILADNTTLIFSSTRPGGFGGYDLYRSERRGNGSWTKPRNLGKSINTPQDDKLLSIPAAGDIMYQSKAVSKDPEVYRIKTSPLPPSLLQSHVLALSGAIMEKDDESKKLRANITITDTAHDRNPIIISSNEKDGSFCALLRKGAVYDVAVTATGYTFYSSRIDLRKLATYRELRQDIYLQPLKVGATMVLNNLYFSVNQFRLLQASRYELDRLVALMRQNPGLAIEISGHTDDEGQEEFNIQLSGRRAYEVVKYLAKNGIARKRLRYMGYGSQIPVGSNATVAGKAQNRRVEIKILSAG